MILDLVTEPMVAEIGVVGHFGFQEIRTAPDFAKLIYSLLFRAAKRGSGTLAAGGGCSNHAGQPGGCDVALRHRPLYGFFPGCVPA
jgi:hypothetical protein